MQKIFLKRTIRDLRENLFRYLALFLLVILCMFMVVGIVGAAQSVIGTVNTHAEENHLEDGQFGVFRPLTEQEKRKLEDAGAVLEAHFYLDFQMDDGSTLRVMENRKKIDLLDLYDGSDAAAPDETAVERIYADAHGIETGDTVTIAGKEFTVSGIVTTADYEYCLRNVSDMSADGKTFGTAFVTPEAYEGLLKSGMAEHSEEYRYSYILRDRLTDAELKEMLSSIKISADQAGNLTDLTTADANPRIKAANDDVVINQSVGLLAGVIVLVLITYVISVFIVHSIDSESSVIGALYALGVKQGTAHAPLHHASDLSLSGRRRNRYCNRIFPAGDQPVCRGVVFLLFHSSAGDGLESSASRLRDHCAALDCLDRQYTDHPETAEPDRPFSAAERTGCGEEKGRRRKEREGA